MKIIEEIRQIEANWKSELRKNYSEDQIKEIDEEIGFTRGINKMISDFYKELNKEDERKN